jgi:hypothetical protein
MAPRTLTLAKPEVVRVAELTIKTWAYDKSVRP